MSYPNTFEMTVPDEYERFIYKMKNCTRCLYYAGKDTHGAYGICKQLGLLKNSKDGAAFNPEQFSCNMFCDKAKLIINKS